MTITQRAQDGSRVLLVDDDEVVLQLHAQVLTSEGFRVETVTDGAAALRALRWTPFDIVLSEIDMRGMNGIQLLERIRTAEPQLPVILLSSLASVPVMDLALEQGALRCLIKPVEPHILSKVVECTVRHQRLKQAKRETAAGDSARSAAPTRSTLVTAFEHALESLYLVFQPIVSWSNQRIVGYQALLRSEEPIMKDARSIIDAAERTGRLHHLGRKIRAAALESLTRLRPEAPLFVHIHPSDLFDEAMFAADAPLTAVASQIVLEIAERDYLRGIKGVEGRVASLRRPGFRLAIGELGAGRAGLTTFGLLDPDFVKLDVALVRDLHMHPENQALVRKISAMCLELDLTLIAEGIENRDERDELARMGCDLMQGHLFARPAASFPLPAF
jgi:EAL domain-containing protein (putative c-di-GMP-specific phosphodiesterase class I)